MISDYRSCSAPESRHADKLEGTPSGNGALFAAFGGMMDLQKPSRATGCKTAVGQNR